MIPRRLVSVVRRLNIHGVIAFEIDDLMYVRFNYSSFHYLQRATFVKWKVYWHNTTKYTLLLCYDSREVFVTMHAFDGQTNGQTDRQNSHR